MLRRLRLLALLPLLALVVTACSGGSDDGIATLQGTSASASATPTLSADEREQLALQFAQCMRENGVTDFPDPVVDEDGNLTLRPGASLPDLSDRQKLEEAFGACQQYAEGLRGSFSEAQRQEMQDAMLEFAQCMRKNGYELADPQYGSPGEGPSDEPRGPFAGIDQDDPRFKKAFEACRDELPGIPTG